MGLELARSGADVLATIGAHSPVTGTPGADRIKGKVLIMNGAEDPTVTAEQYKRFEQEMRDAKVDWQLHFFGGVVHSYTIPETAEFGNSAISRYDPRAAARAWKMTCDLFAEALTPSGEPAK